MDEFVDKVQNGKSSRIAHPIQKKFDLATWDNEFNKITCPSEKDKRLYEMGRWVFNKLALIRGKLPINALSSVTRADLIRCIVGSLNRSAYLMSKLTVADLGSFKEVNSAQIIQSGIPTITGQKATLDSALETLIDAARFPLRIALSMDTEQMPSSSLADEDIIDAVIRASVLGQYYSEIELTWNGGVWEGWYLHPYKEVDFVIPGDPERSRINAVASFRRQSLQAEMLGWSLSFWKSHPGLESDVAPRLVINIYGKGRQQKYKLEKANIADRKVPFSYARRFYAVQEYLEPVLELPLPNFGGITVSTLIQAWELLESLGESILRRVPTNTGVTKIKELTKFAPVVHLNRIIPLFAKGLKVSAVLAENIIAIFTSDDSIKDELWFRPLIKLADGQLLPILSPILHGSFLRIIECWMKEGGVDLDQRGKLFEEYARLHIRSDIQSSKVLKCAGVHPRALTLPDSELDEEIDIILWLGNTILIGEAKCILFPASSLEYHNYFNVLEGKAAQAKRKAKAAIRNKQVLLKLLGIENQVNESQVNVIPFVLINQVLGTGFVINEVPVVDMLILTRYLDGRWMKMGRFEDSEAVSNDITYFFETETEASDRIGSYLEDPPQINLYKDATKLKDYKFPILSSNDRPFSTVFFEVELVGTGLDLTYIE